MPSRTPTSLCAVALAAMVAACGGPQPRPASLAPVVAVHPTPAPTANATPSPSPSPTRLVTPTPVPTLDVLARPTADLTGMPVDPAVGHRLPIAVLIDDNRVARPQSGFNGASLVYQAPADGGETRYMFVYQEDDSRDIGPVRSGRAYFVHWASEVHAAIAHYGGDNVTRAYLAAHDPSLFTSIDALGRGARAFHRIQSRKAPHNGYTSSEALRAMAAALGAPGSMPASIERRPFVDESPAVERGTSQTVTIPYRTGTIEYRYNARANLYQRIVDGKRQIDPADGERVHTRNVVVLFQPFKIDTRIEPGHSRPVVGAIGTGRAFVFREGRLTEATWSKASEAAPTRLLAADGEEMPLVRGKTFIQIVPETTTVTIAD
jgi:hypothetical protein